MNTLSASEMMKIANVMQSRVHKKRLKEQRVEAETIQIAVEFLPSLLLEIAIAHLSTTISKLGQLVADASDHIKSLQDVAQLYVENNHKKKYGDKLAKDIDSGKMAMSQNKDLLRNDVEIGGKYLASTSDFSFFYSNILKSQTKIEQELERICKAYVPLQDSMLAFNKFVDDLHNKLHIYDNEKAKRLRSLKELKSLLTSQVDIL